MERLTYKTELGVSIDKNEDCLTCSICWDCDIPPRECNYISDALEKLADYEDLEEQGRLVKLPCKVGDVVHVVTSPFNVFDDIEYDENMKDEVYESHVSSITFYECGEQYRIYAKATNHFIGAYFRECDFGKTVFLTKSEAKAKLKELRGGENESSN
nr:MAG TPA: hypothetical protein [Bacteriophage sp.]